MSRAEKLRRSLRVRLFAAFVLVIAAGVVTLLIAMVILGPSLFDQVLIGMMGPGAERMADPSDPLMTRMAQVIIQSFWNSMTQALLISACAAILVALAISLLVSARIVVPVQKLLSASRRIATGHYAERVPVSQSDELGALAEQFNIMAAELEATERRRVALIGDVAHELRTPLAAMEGYTEGLLDGMVTPSNETWALLHDEVGRLRRLVQDLQELSRAEAKQLPLHRRAISPAALIAQAKTRMASQFNDRQILLQECVADDLPDVMADPDRILQVLINLLGNALRHTPADGRVTLSAERIKDEIVFRVSDTGAGIAPEHLPHLFERFYRVDKARSRTLGGSGIGLTISKALVEAHGGRIWAESSGSGQGATFSFALPIAS
jgi:signal transduction histidine kinase